MLDVHSIARFHHAVRPALGVRTARMLLRFWFCARMFLTRGLALAAAARVALRCGRHVVPPGLFSVLFNQSSINRWACLKATTIARYALSRVAGSKRIRWMKGRDDQTPVVFYGIPHRRLQFHGWYLQHGLQSSQAQCNDNRGIVFRQLPFDPVMARVHFALRRGLVQASLATRLPLEMLDRVGHVLVTYTWLRSTPASSSALSSNAPAGPTKGLPCRSS